MFSNLTQGNILYGIDTKGEPTLFTAPIEKVVLEPPTYRTNGFGQLPDMRVTIVTNINGEHREFQKVPANNSIADFGPNGAILADSKDSLNAYIASVIQNSQRVVDSYEENKTRVAQYSKVRDTLNPSYGGGDSSSKELRDKVDKLESQLAEAIALLKGETAKANN